MSFRETVGENLKELRKQHGLTLKELSRETGIAISTLTNYENKYTTPKSDKLGILANFFSVPESYLYGSLDSETLVQTSFATAGLKGDSVQITDTTPFGEDVDSIKKILTKTKILDSALNEQIVEIEPIIVEAMIQHLKEAAENFPFIINNSVAEDSHYHYVYEAYQNKNRRTQDDRKTTQENK